MKNQIERAEPTTPHVHECGIEGGTGTHRLCFCVVCNASYPNKKFVERAEPSRGAPEAAAERLARFIAQKESLNCKTLDDAVHHQSKWQRIVPEAKEMLEAAYPDGAGHVVLLEALRPFADLMDEEGLAHMDECHFGSGDFVIQAADIRRARAAIKQAERT